MVHLTNFAAAGLVVAALGFIVAACQMQATTPPVQEAVASADAMTVAEVQALVVGNTVLVRDEKRKVSRTEYFSADGTVTLNAKPDAFGMVFNYEGTYYFNSEGKLCANYPSIPVSQKEYCERVVPLGDGRYELTDGGIYEQILEGEQLDALE